LLNMR